MGVTRRGLLQAAAGVTMAPGRSGRAQGAGDRPIRIGVLSDMSGPYRDVTGPTSVACARQAIEDFGAQGFTVELVTGDHQNKPDIGAGLARQWFDRDHVDMVTDVPNSSVALAVNSIAQEKNKAYINTGATTVDLTGKQCTPVTIHWGFDGYMNAASTGGALFKAGGESWYFITADYVFGHQVERDTATTVTKLGGKVLGSAPIPSLGRPIFLHSSCKRRRAARRCWGWPMPGTTR
jgi:branched-chain amino acid transport system substrate-binding protein